MNGGARFDDNLQYYWFYIHLYISGSLILGNDPRLTKIEEYPVMTGGHPQKNGSGAPDLSPFHVYVVDILSTYLSSLT
jgi:hypothetical protein